MGTKVGERDRISHLARVYGHNDVEVGPGRGRGRGAPGGEGLHGHWTGKGTRPPDGEGYTGGREGLHGPPV